MGEEIGGGVGALSWPAAGLRGLSASSARGGQEGSGRRGGGKNVGSEGLHVGSPKAVVMKTETLDGRTW